MSKTATLFEEGLAHQKHADADKIERSKKNKYFRDASEMLDEKCTRANGLKVGEVCYYDSGIAWNHYTEAVVIGFTGLFGVGNRFCKKPFRRTIIAYRYKGKLDVISCPPKSVFRTPKHQIVPVCVYCHKRPQDRLMHGACRSSRCQLNAMRDSL